MSAFFYFLTPFFVFSALAHASGVCDGRYQSTECHHVFWINNCKQSVSIDWTGLKNPGSKSWEKHHRNWCSLTLNYEAGKKARKLQPAQCDRILAFWNASKKQLPEVAWQDTACTHLSGSDAVLYFKKVQVDPQKQNPTQLYAVRLAEARSCKLEAQAASVEKEKNRQIYRDAKMNFTLHCPVLPDRSFAWLKQFTKQIGVRLEIQNDLK